jgi:hypothetical protein
MNFVVKECLSGRPLPASDTGVDCLHGVLTGKLPITFTGAHFERIAAGPRRRKPCRAASVAISREIAAFGRDRVGK